MKHIPVLLEEVLKEASEMSHPASTILDATFGRGGHSKALKERFPEAQLIGLDRDPEAIAFAKTDCADWSNFKVVHGNFHDIKALKTEIWGEDKASSKFDLALLDLGVSSPQLDEGRRGFSFYHNGPLDMRMDPSKGETAAEIVNEWSSDDLMALFLNYGEIRRPQKVVARIIEQRRSEPFTTTRDLAHLIERSEGWRTKGFHPATPYFLALRMQVNAELSGLEPALLDLMHELNEGGRLLVITFHSLEDRIVKNLFKSQTDLGSPVHKHVIQASGIEKKKNPRSRSAKLRVFEKGRNT